MRELFDPNLKPTLTKMEIRAALEKKLRGRLKGFQDHEEYLDNMDRIAAQRDSEVQKTEGGFARSYIEGIYNTFEERRKWQEAEPDNKRYAIDEPYEELQNTLGVFYEDEELNNAETMISGEDLCKMFDVTLYLAELLNGQKTHVLATAAKLGRLIKRQKTEIAQYKTQLREAEDVRASLDEDAFNIEE